MAVDEGLGEIRKHAVYMGRLVGTNLIDAAFLLAVAVINWVAAWGLGFLDLEGIDLLVQRCLQGVFAAASVLTVLVHLARNVIVAVARMVRSE